ncbi:hypothetical protein [Glutamicibacter sp. PS]|uniref:hypothetical protein n=1 Tax=Glutamicibacter TaxID=1742989 RepID=UPI00283FD7A2|nr:hypothetical protein [Glutamicibacter sp. PS]MDR4532184.1 hypothetical protein [Glutamicibacter sp. PS]
MNSNDSETKFPSGTLIFGLILIAVAVTTMGGEILSWHFDRSLFFIGLIALAGIGLIGSGIASARRNHARSTELPGPDSTETH